MIWKIGTARFGYSATVLKWIALITMTADHIGFILFPQATALRVIGRIAMPVFAYLIAGGCRYSRHRLRYFLTVLGTGAVCSVAAYYAAGTLYQNILITFALSIPIWHPLIPFPHIYYICHLSYMHRRGVVLQTSLLLGVHRAAYSRFFNDVHHISGVFQNLLFIVQKILI